MGLRPRLLFAVVAVGVVWAILATCVHLSVFGGLSLGRASPTLSEVITVAIFAGIVLTFAIATLILGVRRPIR